MVKHFKSIFFGTKCMAMRPRFWLHQSRVPLSSRIESGVDIRKSVIGSYCYFGKDSKLLGVSMGSYCSLGPGAQLGGGEHAWWWGSTSQFLTSGYDTLLPTEIQDDVWIGTYAVIRQGIRIGRGAVIGAHSLVLEDVPPYAISYGIPAKLHRMRFPEALIQQIEETRYWRSSPREAQKLLAAIDYPEPDSSVGFFRRSALK